jgi:hypothetical protein
MLLKTLSAFSHLMSWLQAAPTVWTQDTIYVMVVGEAKKHELIDYCLCCLPSM